MRKLTILIILITLISLFPKQRQEEAIATPSLSYYRTGKASWYSRRSPGIKRRTANNEIFNDNELTCAIWGVAFNRKIRVTNLENGKSVVVRVNDRGPHERLVRRGRVIDLTKEAFRQLGSTRKGLIQVQLEFL